MGKRIREENGEGEEERRLGESLVKVGSSWATLIEISPGYGGALGGKDASGVHGRSLQDCGTREVQERKVWKARESGVIDRSELSLSMEPKEGESPGVSRRPGNSAQYVQYLSILTIIKPVRKSQRLSGSKRVNV